MTKTKEMDRVSGRLVEMQDARFTSRYNGTTYYFCSQSSQHQFVQKS